MPKFDFDVITLVMEVADCLPINYCRAVVFDVLKMSCWISNTMAPVLNSMAKWPSVRIAM